MTMAETKKKYEALKTKYDSEKNKFSSSQQALMDTMLSQVVECFSDFDTRMGQSESKIAELTQLASSLDQSSVLAVQLNSGVASAKQTMVDIEQKTASQVNIILDQMDTMLAQVKSINDAKNKAESRGTKNLDIGSLQLLLQNFPSELAQLENELQSADSKQKAEVQKRRDVFIRNGLQQFHEQKSLLENSQARLNPMQQLIFPLLSMAVEAMIMELEKLLASEPTPLSANAANPNAAQPSASAANVPAASAVVPPNSVAASAQSKSEKDQGPKPAVAVINASAAVSNIATPNPTPSPAILHAASAAAKLPTPTAATPAASAANAANVNAAPSAAAAKGSSSAASKIKWRG